MLRAMSRVTIHDVARAAGVSVATVSKVINRRYGVASATHAKVEQVIEELGYESSLVARSLRSHKTHVIGILVAEFEPFSTEILKGASQAIAGTGYELLAYSGGGRPGSDVGWERRYLSRLSGTLIDGALLVTPTVVDAAAAVPVVAIDPHAGPSGLADGRLRQLRRRRARHRAPAVPRASPDRVPRRTGGPGVVPATRARLPPARWRPPACAVDPALVGVGGYRKDSALGPAADLLALPEPPTAIFAANDLSALGVLAVAAAARAERARRPVRDRLRRRPGGRVVHARR